MKDIINIKLSVLLSCMLGFISIFGMESDSYIQSIYPKGLSQTILDEITMCQDTRTTYQRFSQDQSKLRESLKQLQTNPQSFLSNLQAWIIAEIHTTYMGQRIKDLKKMYYLLQRLKKLETDVNRLNSLFNSKKSGESLAKT